MLATKFSLGAAPRPDTSRTGNSRKNMVASVEASLKRLGTDHIDLLWVHFPDELTPMDELLRGLDDPVSAGRIHHAALSNFPAWRVSRAVTLADLKNWAPIVGIQHEYSRGATGARRRDARPRGGRRRRTGQDRRGECQPAGHEDPRR